jgi:hypothetical protein
VTYLFAIGRIALPLLLLMSRSWLVLIHALHLICLLLLFQKCLVHLFLQQAQKV